MRIAGDIAERKKLVKYLGSVLHASGDIDCVVKARILAAWAKWREVSGVICDPKMPVKLKGQGYKSIIRLVLLYGSETWPVLERHKQSLRVTEMNMLRWICGVTRKDRIRNSRIRGSLHVRDIADKLQELRCTVGYAGVATSFVNRHLTWVTNVLPCYLRRAPVNGKDQRPTDHRPRVVRDDMRANRLTTRDAEDRAKRSRYSRKVDPGLQGVGFGTQPGQRYNDDEGAFPKMWW